MVFSIAKAAIYKLKKANGCSKQKSKSVAICRYSILEKREPKARFVAVNAATLKVNI